MCLKQYVKGEQSVVLILTDQFDVHANVVITELRKEEIPYFRFDLDVESLKKTNITFKNQIWKITKNGCTITSEMISCVWCRRPFVELSLQERACAEVDFKIWRNEWDKTLLGLYNTIKNVSWLNPLRKAYKGENKYYQLDVARKIGLNLPETLISNEKERIKKFVRDHKCTLFKLMSQEIYDVGNNEFKGLYTNIISEDDVMNFGEVGENPIVLQEYIDKKYEVRYTVVDKQHLVCRIESQASDKAKCDWRRYDISNTPHYKMIPPDDIAQKVDRLLEELGLVYGALDFIVTPNDKWVFLEINCMGQWLWIEQLTGLPISKAIVKWISEHINHHGGIAE